MRLFIVLAFPLLFLSAEIQAQAIIQWAHCYGGSNADYSARIDQLAEGEFYAFGLTNSPDGNVSGHHGEEDYWLVKFDTSGAIESNMSYGGSWLDYGNAGRKTSDGGYLMVGGSSSTDGDVSGNHGMSDSWVVKVDSSMAIQWSKSYGGSYNDGSYDLIETDDGGFALSGMAWSNNGDISGNNGACDYWILKIDSVGNIDWSKCYGGSHQDVALCIDQTEDGGYIVAGSTLSDDGYVSGYYGFFDIWVVKLDEYGDFEWEKNYGGSDRESARDLQQTPDGGYIILGYTESNDHDVSGNHGEADYWVVKTDPQGNIEWQKCLGGTLDDVGASLHITEEGDYMIFGRAESNDGDVSGNHGAGDYWVVKIDSSGNILWQHCFGGTSEEHASEIIMANDSNFILAGSSYSNDGDVSGNHGSADYWLVKFCIPSPLDIQISDTMYCDSTELVAVGNFESYLWNTGDTTASIYIDSAGLYSVEAFTNTDCPSSAEILVPGPLEPYNFQEICLVSFNDETELNTIIYEPVLEVGTDSIRFYRSSSSIGTYDMIGSQAVDANGIFQDGSASPLEQSYFYKVNILDTCGHESDLSSEHATMYLQASVGQMNEVNLSWTSYIGMGDIIYDIYRKNYGGDYTIQASTLDTFYIDSFPPVSEVHYQLRVMKSFPCHPGSGVFEYAASNPASVTIVGINTYSNHDLKVYPNPFDEELTICRASNEEQISIELVNIYGQFMGKYILKPGQESLRIPTTELVPGIYFLRFDENQIRRIIKL